MAGCTQNEVKLQTRLAAVVIVAGLRQGISRNSDGGGGSMAMRGKRWSVIGLLLACGVIVAAFAAFQGFFESWNQLAMRISRSGTNVSSSTSMELYKVNLRYQMPAQQAGETSKLLQWELDLPRAYVFDENGTNGNVYVPGRGAETQYALTLSIRADETLTKFTLDTLSKQGGNGERDFLLVFGNSPSSLKTRPTVASDLCLVVDKKPSDCTSRDYRCSIDFQLEGWVVRANLTQDLFKRPEEACAMGKRFLQQYIIKRDDARILASETP
jgi:hypothetical protein